MLPSPAAEEEDEEPEYQDDSDDSEEDEDDLVGAAWSNRCEMGPAEAQRPARLRCGLACPRSLRLGPLLAVAAPGAAPPPPGCTRLLPQDEEEAQQLRAVAAGAPISQVTGVKRRVRVGRGTSAGGDRLNMLKLCRGNALTLFGVCTC